MSGSYDPPDRPLTEAFDHVGNEHRLAALAAAARELGVTRSEVVVSWLLGCTPPVTPILGVSNADQLNAAMAAAPSRAAGRCPGIARRRLVTRSASATW